MIERHHEIFFDVGMLHAADAVGCDHKLLFPGTSFEFIFGFYYLSVVGGWVSGWWENGEFSICWLYCLV